MDAGALALRVGTNQGGAAAQPRVPGVGSNPDTSEDPTLECGCEPSGIILGERVEEGAQGVPGVLAGRPEDRADHLGRIPHWMEIRIEGEGSRPEFGMDNPGGFRKSRGPTGFKRPYQGGIPQTGMLPKLGQPG